jgi:hypothetical protein
VERRGAEALKRIAVLWRGVAFVGGEAIAREIAVIAFHEAVAVDLGEDGGGGDGEGEVVAANDGSLLVAGVAGERKGVEEKGVGRAGERLKGAEHGAAARADDAVLVYLCRVGLSDGEGEGDLADEGGEGDALRRRELLGVPQARRAKEVAEGAVTHREDDGPRDDRTREAAAPYLVKPGNIAVPGKPEFGFVVEGRSHSG